MIDLIVSIVFLPVAMLAFFRSWKKSLFLSADIAIVVPPLVLLIIPAILIEGVHLVRASILGIFIIVFLVCINHHYQRRSFRFGIYLTRNSALVIIAILAAAHFAATVFPSLQVIRETGFIGAFTRNRLSTYFSSEMGRADALLPIRIATEPIFFIMLGYLYINKRFTSFVFLSSCYVLAISTTANTRLSLVFPIVALIGGVLHRRRTSTKSLIIIGCLLAAALPWYTYTSNMLRHGAEVRSLAADIAFDYALSEINYNKFVESAVEHTNDNQMELGYGWVLGSAGNLIPRTLWNEKPITSSSNRFTTKLTGEEPSLNNPVITFTIIGDGFLQFGYIGVIIEVALYVVVMSKIFWSFLNQHASIGAFAAMNFATMMLVYFRAEVPFVQIFTSFFALWLATSLCRVKIPQASDRNRGKVSGVAYT